jgi:hypothetical protein
MGNAKTVIPLIAPRNPYQPHPIAPFHKRVAGLHAQEGSSPYLLFQ